MRFNIQSKLLLNRLSAVSKVIGNKNAYAILDNFLFELEGDTLVVTGSDLETRLTAAVNVTEAEGSGKLALDVRRMLNILKELPDTALSFDINDETLEVNIKYPNGEFKIAGLSGDEYPARAIAAEEPKVMQLPQKQVVSAIQRTVFAVGNDPAHTVFMGVYWDIMPDRIVFVATDSHVLVRFKHLNVQPGFEASFILPTKPAQILTNVLDKSGEEPVRVSIDDKSVTFETVDLTLSCRTINGRYPRYEAVIPTDVPYNVTVDRVSLLNALRRVAVLASPGGLVQMDIRANEIGLRAQDLDHATSASETVPCDYNGPEMTMGFNNDNIVDVVGNIDSESLTIQLVDPARAGIFLPGEQPEGEDLLILQMPMMV